MGDASKLSGKNPAPIFFTSPCTLEYLASMRIARLIWLEEYLKYSKNVQMTKSDIVCVPRKSNSFYQHCNVPFKISQIIESSFDTVVSGMTLWYDISQFVLKLQSNHSVSISHRFDQVVFSGNGTIHLEDTLGKFFADDSLEEITKFEIACAFCVEKKVDFYWPMVSDTSFIENTHFSTSFILQYWICKKRGELNQTPSGSCGAVERLMIDHCCQCGGFFQAVEYFLNSLNSQDRLVEIDRLCVSAAGFKCIRNLLPRFEPSVQYHVLGEQRIRILIDMIENEESIEYVVQCWRWLHSNGFVEAERFYQEIILRSIRNVRRFEPYTYVEIVLAEIWLDSPYRLKQYALDFHLNDILRELSQRTFHHFIDFDRDISFLLALLSDVDSDIRCEFFLTNWSKLIVNLPPGQFQKLMKLCLVHSEIIEYFSESFTRKNLFRHYCDRLMVLGYQDELNEFLNSLHSNLDLVLDLKKMILTSCTLVLVCQSSPDILLRHSNYIDYVLSNDTLSKELKYQIILSDQVSGQLRNKIYKNDFSHAKSIAEVFLSSAEHREILKSNFLNFFRDKIVDGRLSGFDESVWREFLLWCLNEDVESLDKFMDSLPIDRIFQSAFNRCLTCEPVFWTLDFLNLRKYEDMDKFFIWYFKSKRASYQNFKCEKVEFYEAMDEGDVRRIFRRDKRLVVALMRRQTLRS